jgi:GT2 family glycosyltransferase
MTRKRTFTEVGWFDEGIFMYMEEIDFQHRAKKQGYEVIFYPDARFIHVGHASSEDRTNPILNVFRGLIYFYKKHYNGIPLLILRVVLVLKSIAAIVLFTLLGRGKDRRLYQKAFILAIS